VCFVRLAPIQEAELLATTIMSALGISEAASEAPLATLKRSLQEQPLLLVLDNFEHLREAAPVLAELVAECTRLTLLVTSRASLHLSGEHVYPLDALPLRQAIALFTERAKAVRPDFAGDETVLAAICERLDCLPLALELAAARSRLLSPQELLTRLEHRLELLTSGPRDLSDRQQTLRATIDWSYELLEQEEQLRYARLAVFAGGCTLQAADRVCAATLDQLDSLVDMNLLKRRETAGEGRFWMLETIREHALERLEARGEAEELRRRHAEHFLGFAEEARGFARGPREIEWFDRLELELDNIRTALSWSVERPEGVLGLRLVEALEPYWYRRSHLREGLLWLESLLELGAAAPPAIRAGALGLAGRLVFELGGEDPRVRPWYEESLVLARASGDRTREAWALHGLGTLAWREDDHDRARNLFEQSLELFLELGEHGPAGGRLSYLGGLALQAGDTHAARSYLERSIEEYAAAGDHSGVVGSMAGVAEVALEEGDFDAALRSYCAALPRTTEPTNLVWILAGMAAAAAATGRAAEAARLWGASQRLDQEIDHSMSPVERARYEKHLGSLDERQVAAGRALGTADAVALGLRLLGHVATK
jgi:predicted ATPase